MSLGAHARPPVCHPLFSSRDPVSIDELFLNRIREVGGQLASVGGPVGSGVLACLSAGGLIVTAQGARLDALRREDLIVVLDVDPVKGVLLVRGPGEPSPWAGVLSWVLRHRPDQTAAFFTQATDAPASGEKQEMAALGANADSRGTKEPSQGDLEEYRVRGWGFDEGPPMEFEQIGDMVEWAGWALKGLREGSVALLPHGHVVAVGRCLEAVARNLRENHPKSD